MPLMGRSRDETLQRIRDAFQAHRRALDELEEALLEGFENLTDHSAYAPIPSAAKGGKPVWAVA